MFDDINKAIENKLQERKIQADADCAVPVYKGVVMSKPGTEKVLLKTVDFDFMTCVSAGETNKIRYCIVRKNQPVRYDTEMVNSDGHPVSIVTKIVFDAMITLAQGAIKQLRDKQQQIEMLSVKCEAYEMTISGLRKNGVID